MLNKFFSNRVAITLVIATFIITQSLPSLAQKKGGPRLRDSRGRFTRNPFSGISKPSKSQGKSRGKTYHGNGIAENSNISRPGGYYNYPPPRVSEEEELSPDFFYAKVINVETGDTLLVEDLDSSKKYRVHIAGIAGPPKTDTHFTQSREALKAILKDYSYTTEGSESISSIIIHPTKWVRETACHADVQLWDIEGAMKQIQYTLPITDKSIRQILSDRAPSVKSLAWSLVRMGSAKWDRKGAPENTNLEMLEKIAKDAHLGVWASSKP